MHRLKDLNLQANKSVLPPPPLSSAEEKSLDTQPPNLGWAPRRSLPGTMKNSRSVNVQLSEENSSTLLDEPNRSPVVSFQSLRSKDTPLQLSILWNFIRMKNVSNGDECECPEDRIYDSSSQKRRARDTTESSRSKNMNASTISTPGIDWKFRKSLMNYRFPTYSRRRSLSQPVSPKTIPPKF
ncbi:hypothetical protein MMC06_000130 [Schaereria dolodes]|nr:hypothetical protein [Schaereria dolodes]